MTPQTIVPKLRVILFLLFTFTIVPTVAPAAFAQSPEVIQQATEETTQDPSDEESSDEESSGENSEENQETDHQPMDLGIGNLLDSEALSNSWLREVNDSLAALGLPENNIGTVIASIAVILVGFIIWYVIRRVLYFLLDRVFSASRIISIEPARTRLYRKFISFSLSVALVCLVTLSLCNIWLADPASSVIYNKTFGFFRFYLTLAFLVTLALVAYEAIRSLVEHVFERWSVSSSPRVKTLLPIARNVINITLFIIFGITIISEMGINIMPLLAGAGVLGFAVGFGAQTFIKDLITGFIIIFEDLIQVGDVASVGGKSGLVEKITVRKVQLRALDGSVFTVPFSEISIVENMTKGYSFYLMNIRIALREDPDEVIGILRSLSEEMLEDETYAQDILEPIEVLGVDAFADSAVIIKARIKTKPIKQWSIGREFNRRMKHRFDKEGIEIPFPHQTLYFGQDKSGEVTKARFDIVKINAEDAEPANDDSATEAHRPVRTDKADNVESDHGDSDGSDR